MSLTTSPTDITVEVHLDADDWDASLRGDAYAGLTGYPKELQPTWLYDERGCESETTRLLLDAMSDTGRLERFVPFDVAESTLRAAAGAAAEEYPGVRVAGVVGDFRRHLSAIPGGGRRLVAFLGGTIGNLLPAERAVLLAELAAAMHPGDSLLLGTDLVKDQARLVAAYDDGAGVTAEFNKNVLLVLNRKLGADFDPDRFDHVARFDQDEEWIEMRLRSRGDQAVRIPALDLTI